MSNQLHLNPSQIPETLEAQAPHLLPEDVLGHLGLVGITGDGHEGAKDAAGQVGHLQGLGLLGLLGLLGDGGVAGDDFWGKKWHAAQNIV